MIDRVNAILSQVELKHYPLFYRFEPTIEPGGLSVDGREAAPGVRIDVIYSWQDRDTGEPIDIHVHTGPTLREGASDTDILWAARNLLVFIAVHEVDEGFHFAGTRVFDPHATGGTADVCISEHFAECEPVYRRSGV